MLKNTQIDFPHFISFYFSGMWFICEYNCFVVWKFGEIKISPFVFLSKIAFRDILISRLKTKRRFYVMIAQIYVIRKRKKKENRNLDREHFRKVINISIMFYSIKYEKKKKNTIKVGLFDWFIYSFTRKYYNN